MALSYISQAVCAGDGKEFLFRLDALFTGRGYTRLGSRTAWPAAYTGLATNEYVAWRNPSSALSRWDLQADMTDGTPDSITFIITPVVSEPCWTARNTWGTNASNDPVTVTVRATGFRLSVTADDNSIFGVVEQGAGSKGFYVGRVATPLETATADPHPVVAWAGDLTLTAFLTGWKKIYALDMTTPLTAGVQLYLTYPGDATKDPAAPGKGQTTLTGTVNWHWETPIVAFDEGGKRERVGRPDGIFIRESSSTLSVWGADGEYAQMYGIVFRWSPGVPIDATLYA